MLKTTRVSRCLFGPVDHDVIQKDLKAKLHEITQEGCQRWNFDFSSDVPMRGYFDWRPDGDIPTFYHKKSVPSKPVNGFKCCARERKRVVDTSKSSTLANLRRLRAGLTSCDVTKSGFDVDDVTKSGLAGDKSADDAILRHPTHNRVPRVQNDGFRTSSPSWHKSDVMDTAETRMRTVSPFVPVNYDFDLAQSQLESGAKTIPDLSSLMSSTQPGLKPSILPVLRSPKPSARPRTPSAFVPVNLSQSAKGVAKRGVKSPRISAKKLRLTPITSLFRTTKLSHSRPKPDHQAR